MATLSRLTTSVRALLNEPLPVPRAGGRESIAGKRILVTGASAGIGRAAATQLAGQGASVVLVARRERELALVRAEIAAAGGEAVHRACDLSRREEVDALIRWVLDEHGGVDVLVNNAGRSMRRAVVDSFERLDDFDRAMAVNFFGPVRLTMGLLPAMLERRAGQVVNVGTWTVPAGTSPRFAAYHSSKAALEGFSRCIGAELAGRGVRVTDVHFPLVHTAMSAPTERYRELPGLTPEQAAEWIAVAIRSRPVRIAPRYVLLLRALSAVSPRVVDRLLLRWG